MSPLLPPASAFPPAFPPSCLWCWLLVAAVFDSTGGMQIDEGLRLLQRVHKALQDSVGWVHTWL